MKSRFLFPRKLRPLGYALFIVGLLYFAFTSYAEKSVVMWHGFWTNSVLKGIYVLTGPDEAYDNELQLAIVLIGLLLVAFTKEEVEDEQISQLRLDSLQWAVYVNYAVFFAIIFLVYGMDFHLMTMYNVFTLLLFFIIRFRWMMYRASKNELERV